MGLYIFQPLHNTHHRSPSHHLKNSCQTWTQWAPSRSHITHVALSDFQCPLIMMSVRANVVSPASELRKEQPYGEIRYICDDAAPMKLATAFLLVNSVILLVTDSFVRDSFRTRRGLV